MVVGVDEAGSEHESCAIDHAIVRARPNRADLGDGIAHHAQVGAPQGGAGAVGDLGTSDDPRVLAGRTGANQRQQEAGNE